MRSTAMQAKMNWESYREFDNSENGENAVQWVCVLPISGTKPPMNELPYSYSVDLIVR